MWVGIGRAWWTSFLLMTWGELVEESVKCGEDKAFK